MLMHPLVRAGLLAIGLGVTACSGPSELEQIVDLEDRRTLGRSELRRALHAGSSGGIRARAARAAGRIQSETLVDDLLPLIEENDPDVVSEAAFALGQIALAHPGTRDRIGNALTARISRDDSSAVASRELANALGKARYAGAIPVLSHLLGNRDPAVRGEALLALARIGPEAPVEAFIPRLDDSDASVRWKAAYAIAGRADPRVVRKLTATLTDSVPEVRRMVCWALGRSDQGEAADVIADHLAAGEWSTEVVVGAVTALGTMGASERVDVIEKFVHSPWPQVRSAAAAALGRLDPARTEDILIGLTGDSSAGVRTWAVAGLARSGSEQSTSVLLAMEDDPSPRVWAEVVLALGPSHRHVLETALEDEDPRVRAAALVALARIGDTVAINRLRQAVHDPVPRVAAIAIGSLGATGGGGSGENGEDATGSFLWSLYQPAADVAVRRAVARALGPLGDPESCRLRPLLTDSDYAVRVEGWSAIQARGSEDACAFPARWQVYSLERPGIRPTRYPDMDQRPQRGEIVTDLGSFTIRFFAREAPRTVENFMRLARAGRFDGVGFAAAVPDSVLVLADPSIGGTPLRSTIRDEVGFPRFERGTLGMWELGRDDACDRFFIALAPQPELDGLRTAFAEVSHGMGVVDRLQPENRIERVIIR